MPTAINIIENKNYPSSPITRKQQVRILKNILEEEAGVESTYDDLAILEKGPYLRAEVDHIVEICRALKIKQSMKVIDLGAGAGHIGFSVALFGASVTLVEYDNILSWTARSIYGRLLKEGVNLGKVSIIHGDFLNPKINLSGFDAAFYHFNGAFEDLQNNLIHKVSRQLRPGAKFVAYNVYEGAKGNRREVLSKLRRLDDGSLPFGTRVYGRSSSPVKFTKLERNVLGLKADGKTYKEIIEELSIPQDKLFQVMKALRKKAGIKERGEGARIKLIEFARQNGIVLTINPFTDLEKEVLRLIQEGNNQEEIMKIRVMSRNRDVAREIFRRAIVGLEDKLGIARKQGKLNLITPARLVNIVRIAQAKGYLANRVNIKALSAKLEGKEFDDLKRQALELYFSGLPGYKIEDQLGQRREWFRISVLKYVLRKLGFAPFKGNDRPDDKLKAQLLKKLQEVGWLNNRVKLGESKVILVPLQQRVFDMAVNGYDYEEMAKVLKKDRRVIKNDVYQLIAGKLGVELRTYNYFPNPSTLALAVRAIKKGLLPQDFDLTKLTVRINQKALGQTRAAILIGLAMNKLPEQIVNEVNISVFAVRSMVSSLKNTLGVKGLSIEELIKMAKDKGYLLPIYYSIDDINEVLTNGEFV
ncbi:class I SAM-dependent methyltransferase, partial [bacterium]